MTPEAFIAQVKDEVRKMYPILCVTWDAQWPPVLFMVPRELDEIVSTPLPHGVMADGVKGPYFDLVVRSGLRMVDAVHVAFASEVWMVVTHVDSAYAAMGTRGEPLAEEYMPRNHPQRKEAINVAAFSAPTGEGIAANAYIVRRKQQRPRLTSWMEGGIVPVDEPHIGQIAGPLRAAVQA